MKWIEFAKSMTDANTVIDYEGVSLCHQKLISNSPADDIHPEGYDGLVICMEECNELAKEISKCYRNKGSFFDLLQEMADVWLIIEYLKTLYEISDETMAKAINVKIKRNMRELGLSHEGGDDYAKDSEVQ